MKILQHIITASLLSLSLNILAGTIPELKFQLENTDDIERLSWVYEVAYRLSDYQRKLNSGETQATNEVFCNMPPPTSEQLIDYLNKYHAGEYITGPQALQTIFRELETAYPCS